jgi:hypothetical protein
MCWNCVGLFLRINWLWALENLTIRIYQILTVETRPRSLSTEYNNILALCSIVFICPFFFTDMWLVCDVNTCFVSSYSVFPGFPGIHAFINSRLLHRWWQLYSCRNICLSNFHFGKCIWAKFCNSYNITNSWRWYSGTSIIRTPLGPYQTVLVSLVRRLVPSMHGLASHTWCWSASLKLLQQQKKAQRRFDRERLDVWRESGLMRTTEFINYAIRLYGGGSCVSNMERLNSEVR